MLDLQMQNDYAHYSIGGEIKAINKTSVQG